MIMMQMRKKVANLVVVKYQPLVKCLTRRISPDKDPPVLGLDGQVELAATLSFYHQGHILTLGGYNVVKFYW